MYLASFFSWSSPIFLDVFGISAHIHSLCVAISSDIWQIRYIREYVLRCYVQRYWARSPYSAIFVYRQYFWLYSLHSAMYVYTSIFGLILYICHLHVYLLYLLCSAIFAERAVLTARGYIPYMCYIHLYSLYSGLFGILTSSAISLYAP